MQTLSKKESERILKKLGMPEKKGGISGYAQRIKDEFKSGISQVGRGLQQAEGSKGVSGLGSLGLGATNVLAGGLKTAFSPLTAAVTPAMEKVGGTSLGGKYLRTLSGQDVAEAVSSFPGVQKFAESKAGRVTLGIAEATQNLAEGAGYVVGPTGAAKATSRLGMGFKEGLAKVPATATRATTSATERLATSLPKASSAMRGIAEGIPSATRAALQPLKKENIINSQVARAFRLAPVEDLAQFKRIAGVDAGEYLVKNNLLKDGVGATKQALSDFNKTNYTAVRTEIGKVKNVYKETDIPRYRQAVDLMLEDVVTVPGLEKKVAELSRLSKKSTLTLNDVQRVKELVDDTYSIYNRSGETKSQIKAQGLDNVRKDLKVFIEDQVRTNTGADIRRMNNNVAATRELMDAIAKREGKASTNTGIMSATGYGLGGFAVGGPVGAGVGLIVRNIVQNPEMRLRFAKWVSTLGETERMNILDSVRKGKTPSSLKEFWEKTKKAVSDESGFIKLGPDGKPIDPADITDSRIDTGSAFYNRLNKYEDEAREIADNALMDEGKFIRKPVRDPIDPKVTGGKSATTELFEEAKKYPTAEEFVSKMQGNATQYGDYIPNARLAGLDGYENITKLGVKPDTTITIYRGIDDIKGNLPRKINDGDFVTTDFDSALAYAGKKENVVSMKVKAKHLYASEPKDFKAEPFYVGSEYVYTTKGGNPLTKSQLTDIWKKANKK